MLFWIYNALLILALPLLGCLLSLRALIYKKRSFLSYIYPSIVKKNPKLKTLWIHAVSLGEVNTAAHFIDIFSQTFTDYEIYVSTMTETGFKAASCIKNVKAFYLPLDLVFFQYRVIKAIKPTCFIAIEGDIWPSLTKLLEKKKVFQALVSAKISQKSVQRLAKFKSIASFLYGSLNFIYAQDDVMKQRFETLGIESKKVVVLANLKYGKPLFPQLCPLKKTKLDTFLCLDPLKKTVVISCTHEKEELLLLNALQNLCADINMILIPRHPARCRYLYQQLKEQGFKVCLYSEHKSLPGDIFLIDETGLMCVIYEKADLVILGGSFIKDIGGHNLLEPVYCLCPVIVGPYMHTQIGLLKLMHKYGLGIQTSLNDLLDSIDKILAHPEYKKRLQQFINLKQDPAHELIRQLMDDFSLSLN